MTTPRVESHNISSVKVHATWENDNPHTSNSALEENSIDLLWSEHQDDYILTIHIKIQILNDTIKYIIIADLLFIIIVTHFAKNDLHTGSIILDIRIYLQFSAQDWQ